MQSETYYDFDLTLVLDRSGSMSKIREATVKAVNDFIEDQKTTPGEGVWTFVTFDDPASAAGANEAFPLTVCECVPQEAAPHLDDQNFKPRGSTALVDALCVVLERLEVRLKAHTGPVRPKAMVIIMTDGQENASVYHTNAQLRERTARLESTYGVKFMFLGANVDAFHEARATVGVRDARYVKGYTHTDAGVEGLWASNKVDVRAWKNDNQLDVLSRKTPETTPPQAPGNAPGDA